MSWVELLAPYYGLVLVVDGTGKVKASLHDEGGRSIAWISEAHRHPLTGQYDALLGIRRN
jgi:hypothetical protein